MASPVNVFYSDAFSAATPDVVSTIPSVEPSTFDPGNLLVDPTNTGDTGVLQNTSTPFLPSINNPETAGTDSLGSVLNNAINAGFSAWQLSSQPKGTPKVITTTTGPGGKTTIVSGRSTGVAGLFGQAGSPQQQSIINLAIIVVIGFIIYKLVVK